MRGVPLLGRRTPDGPLGLDVARRLDAPGRLMVGDAQLRLLGRPIVEYQEPDCLRQASALLADADDRLDGLGDVVCRSFALSGAPCSSLHRLRGRHGAALRHGLSLSRSGLGVDVYMALALGGRNLLEPVEGWLHLATIAAPPMHPNSEAVSVAHGPPEVGLAPILRARRRGAGGAHHLGWEGRRALKARLPLEPPPRLLRGPWHSRCDASLRRFEEQHQRRRAASDHPNEPVEM
mmetsp:Transcript_20395/g.59129  ORF Transcript_20395/g.59129 Transcript_20395/m.59129 type:complete len:235 (+) Transcript_20395:93-797(+)